MIPLMPIPLAQMPCSVKDALLAANFDEASLLNRLTDCGCFATSDCDAHTLAHALIHRETQVAVHLENFLDRMHARHVAEVSETETELLATYCRKADWRSSENLGGVLWALARDPRAKVQRSFRILIQRISRSAFRPETELCAPSSLPSLSS